MRLVSTRRWESLERRSPTAFLVAGALFVIFAVVWGLGTYTGLQPRPAVDVFGPVGWTAAFLGLLGLYPRLADRSPRAAQAGAVFVAVGVAGAAVTAVTALAELAGVVTDPPAWFAAFNLPIFVGIIPGFLAFGVATLSTGARSRTLGLLLLAPAVIFSVNFVRVLVLGPTTPQWAPFLLGAGQAAALLAVGYSLVSAGTPPDSAAVSTDSAT